MRRRIFGDELRRNIWFRPTLWVITLGLLALILTATDRRISQHELYEDAPWLFHGGADGARAMLGAIGASMLTVATLAYSIVMLAVVQAANAYSPRILRQYLADTAQQDVLGILMGTFLYNLLVLRMVRVTERGSFVPSLSVNVALLLLLLSIGAFIFFIHHVAHSIEVRHIVGIIQAEAKGLLAEVFPEGLGTPWPGDEPPAVADGVPGVIAAAGGGYVQFIDPDGLLAAVMRAGAVARLERTTGDYVLPGMPLASIWPAEAATDDLTSTLREAFRLGRERTLVQDLHFALRQLSDIALRALSPAVNDPSTAVNCIDVLATVLVEMARRPPVSPYRCGPDGRLRVIARGPTLETALEQAFQQVRHYAATDPACTVRLIEALGEIGLAAASPSARAALWRHVGMVARSADRHLDEPHDRATINDRLARAAEMLGQDMQPLLLDLTAPESAIQATP